MPFSLEWGYLDERRKSRAVLCCVVVGVAYMIIPPLNVLRSFVVVNVTVVLSVIRFVVKQSLLFEMIESRPSEHVGNTLKDRTRTSGPLYW